MSGARSPPRPSRPWQPAHVEAKIRAPSLDAAASSALDFARSCAKAAIEKLNPYKSGNRSQILIYIAVDGAISSTQSLHSTKSHFTLRDNITAPAQKTLDFLVLNPFTI